VHALWSLFQWTQLVAARTGGSAFCSLDPDSTSCAEIWDSPFATAIQSWTGMPVAGFGLVWSLAAFGLPLAALAARAGAGGGGRAGASAWSASLWMALGGLAAVAVLFSVSVLEGHLCTTCVVTYTIVATYAAICFVQTPIRSVSLAPGISLASGSLALSFVLLFVPGLRTPVTATEAGEQVLEQIASREPAKPSAPSAGIHDAPGPEDPVASLARMFEELSPEIAQIVSDELHRYATSAPVAVRDPRALHGSGSAPVRLTEFTDALCAHCASLHETVSQLSRALPSGSFALEARHFPLDPSCNPELEGESSAPVRCVAAKSVICLEERDEVLEYAGRLYEHQQSLTEEKIYELAEPLMPRAALASCVNAPETEAKLRDDIAWAAEHDIHGTPLVLLNGRPVAAFGPLLYALIVTEGDASHAVFESLPDPRPPGPAHVH
jgi:serine/threonine-protein kinase